MGSDNLSDGAVRLRLTVGRTSWSPTDMTHLIDRKKRRGLRPGSLVLLTVLASLVFAVSPAAAHNNDGSNTSNDAIHEGCGPGYNYVSGTWRAIYINSEYAGGVILGRYPGSTRFCVVTYKVNGWDDHGVATWMEAHIWREGQNRIEDEGDFKHYANVTNFGSNGLCLGYAGYIENQEGDGARRIADYPKGCMG